MPSLTLLDMYVFRFAGKWHLGVHCDLTDLYCHHPLRQGFDYYYGIPLTNLRDFGNDHRYLVTAGLPLANSILISMIVGGAILVSFLARRRLVGWRLGVPLALVLILPPSYVYVAFNQLKLLNSMVMRGLESVEQPIDFETITGQLVAEGVGFMESRKADGRPFLLVMSWIQVKIFSEKTEVFCILLRIL